ncbi:hypothetical protein GCM10009821_15490 [Aeromicrobium halocynthiae]|uniref:QsdR TetR regulatory C-terminal domain-containing protein n=2 Tax=Aeromicrobium halocynthiae TaxID=560557 RepID=A0ABN2VYU6_9ACTN
MLEGMRSARVVTLGDAVVQARRILVRTGGLDMDELATRLAVSRATLYRVVGSRDRVLTEVTWTLVRDLLERCVHDAHGDGLEWVLDVTRRYTAALSTFEPYGTFVRAEPDTVARIVFGADGVHQRAVTAQRRILERAGLGPAERLHEAAHVYVRVVESGMFADVFVGREVRDTVTEQAARAVLEQLTTG